MSKETINVKANGLRNELKEIRKSIDTLTHALHILIETQTNKQHEKKEIIHELDTRDAPDGMRWVTNHTTETNEK